MFINYCAAPDFAGGVSFLKASASSLGERELVDEASILLSAVLRSASNDRGVSLETSIVCGWNKTRGVPNAMNVMPNAAATAAHAPFFNNDILAFLFDVPIYG